MKYVSVRLTIEEYEILKKYLEDEDILEMVERNKKIVEVGKSKKERTQQAKKAKIKASKEKIQNAINLLRLEGEEITPYRVAKLANISYNTAKKYLSKHIKKQ